MRRYKGLLFALLFFAIGFFTSQQTFATKNQATIAVPGLTFAVRPSDQAVGETKTKSLSFSFTSGTYLALKKTSPIAPLADLIIIPTPTRAAQQKMENKQMAQLSDEVITQQMVTNEDLIPTPTQIPTVLASSVSSSNPGGLNADRLFAIVNMYRQSHNLPVFQKDARSCQLAADRAPEIASEIANGNMHAGMYGRHLPYWNTENIISMRTEEEAFNWWINDYIHRVAIEGPYQYSCVACSGNSCAEEFTNFQPK